MNRLLLTMVHSRADRCIDLNDYGQSRGCVSLVGGGSRLAVVVTVAKGYDLGYIWKTQDETAGRAIGGYYIDAAQAWEPPGRWWGPGAKALGFAQGQVVRREPYEAVYQQVDPRTGARLGRPRGRYATFADHLARLRAAEPLRSAEPAPATDTPRDGTPPQTGAWIRDLAAQHYAFRETLNRHQHLMTPRDDLDWAAPGATLPTWWAPHRDAILHPPKPEITPSATILQLAAEHDIEPEADG